MTSAVFPDEIIDEIMQYWGGHRLGLTCSTLLARMLVDNYVVTADKVGPDGRQATTASLPNGIFHGISSFSVDSSDEKTFNIRYDRGNICHIDTFWPPTNLVVARNELILGRVCQWMTGTKHAFIDDIKFRYGGPLENFRDAVLDRIGTRGTATKLPFDDKWVNETFPHIEICDFEGRHKPLIAMLR